MHVGYWRESQKERGHYENKDVGGWIILKWILEKSDGVIWTRFIWLRIKISESFCEYFNEPSGTTKFWGILE
jgi:hypothetical protein